MQVDVRSTFTPEIAQAICERIAEGKTLTEVCKMEDMPGRSTVYEWIERHPEFAEQMEAARLVGADAIADDALSIADTPEIGERVEID